MTPPSSKCRNGFKSTLLILWILIFLPHITVEFQPEETLRTRRELVGSRPPACTNKCLSCRPCMATLVVEPPRRKGVGTSKHESADGGYYHLSWKCKCGNKLFQP